MNKKGTSKNIGDTKLLKKCQKKKKSKYIFFRKIYENKSILRKRFQLETFLVDL